MKLFVECTFLKSRIFQSTSMYSEDVDENESAEIGGRERRVAYYHGYESTFSHVFSSPLHIHVCLSTKNLS